MSEVGRVGGTGESLLEDRLPLPFQRSQMVRPLAVPSDFPMPTLTDPDSVVLGPDKVLQFC